MQTTSYQEDLENGVPVAGLPQTVKMFIRATREFLRDHPVLNRLQKGRAHSNRLIVWAVLFTVEDINNSPPFLQLSFPQINKMLLLHGTVAFLLKSRSILATRNTLRYNDGQMSVDPENAQLYLQLASTYDAMYREDKKTFLTGINMHQAFGGIPSEYSITNSLWGII